MTWNWNWSCGDTAAPPDPVTCSGCNISISVRVLSPGDDGPVTQSTTVSPVSISKNVGSVVQGALASAPSTPPVPQLPSAPASESPQATPDVQESSEPSSSDQPAQDPAPTVDPSSAQPTQVPVAAAPVSTSAPTQAFEAPAPKPAAAHGPVTQPALDHPLLVIVKLRASEKPKPHRSMVPAARRDQPSPPAPLRLRHPVLPPLHLTAAIEGSAPHVSAVRIVVVRETTRPLVPPALHALIVELPQPRKTSGTGHVTPRPGGPAPFSQLPLEGAGLAAAAAGHGAGSVGGGLMAALAAFFFVSPFLARWLRVGTLRPPRLLRAGRRERPG